MGIVFLPQDQRKMIAEASAGRSSNWKLYVVAITCVCFLAGMLVNSVSDTAPADNQLDSVVTQALKMFHGSKANMPNDDDYLAGEADFQNRFKTLKGKADLYLQNETLTAWKTMNAKNVSSLVPSRRPSRSRTSPAPSLRPSPVPARAPDPDPAKRTRSITPPATLGLTPFGVGHPVAGTSV